MTTSTHTHTHTSVTPPLLQLSRKKKTFAATIKNSKTVTPGGHLGEQQVSVLCGIQVVESRFVHGSLVDVNVVNDLKVTTLIIQLSK